MGNILKFSLEDIFVAIFNAPIYTLFHDTNIVNTNPHLPAVGKCFPYNGGEVTR